MLAWWQGVVTNTGATESGEDVIVDQHYQTVATLKAQDGWVLTLHEMMISGEDAWVTANKNIPMRPLPLRGATTARWTTPPCRSTTSDRQAPPHLGRP